MKRPALALCMLLAACGKGTPKEEETAPLVRFAARCPGRPDTSFMASRLSGNDDPGEPTLASIDGIDGKMYTWVARFPAACDVFPLNVTTPRDAR